MIFCLYNILIRQLFSNLPKFDVLVMQTMVDTGLKSNPVIQNSLRLLDEFEKASTELFDKYGDPSAGPVHTFCFQLAPTFLRKIRELIDTSSQGSLAHAEGTLTYKDHILRVAVLMTERKINTYKACLPSNHFLWFGMLTL